MQLLKTPKRRSKTTTDGRDAKVHLCRQWWWHCRAGIALCRIMGIETARQTQKDHQDRAYIKSWRATGPTAADATKVTAAKDIGLAWLSISRTSWAQTAKKVLVGYI